MNRAVRIAAAIAVASAVAVVAARPSQHPMSAPQALPVDPAVVVAAVAFVTGVADLDPAHPRGALSALGNVAAPDLVAATHAAQLTTATAPPHVAVVNVAVVVANAGRARAFVAAELTRATGAAPVAVGYLLTLQHTPVGWRVTGLTS